TGLLWRFRMGWFVLGVLLGGLPEWLYEVRYFPSARFMLSQAGGVPAAPFFDRLTAVVGSFLPRLLGLSFPAGPFYPVAFLVIALPFWLGALVWAAHRDRAELAWLLGFRGVLGRGHVILWIVASTNLVLILITKRPIDHYYLLPLYSVLPCWMGALLDRLRREGRSFVTAALVGLLAFHGWGQWRGARGRHAPARPRAAHPQPPRRAPPPR